MYRVQEFAQLANITVRTLHHYDRMGLLRPSLRSESGYRLYRNEDLPQLERILVLRYLGMSLREIADLLAHAQEEELAETLARQVCVLRERQHGIARVLRAVEHAQQQLTRDTRTDWTLYQTILKEIHMQEEKSWPEKYYSPEALDTLTERQKQFTPEAMKKAGEDWQVLFADVRSAMERGVPVASDEARALADRWVALIQVFTGGDPQVWQGLQRMYKDHDNWSGEQKQQHSVDPKLMGWIREVQAAR